MPVLRGREATNERLAELADEGKVRVEYRPFVLLSSAGDYSRRATAAFRSGPGGARDRAWPRSSTTYCSANQPSEAGPFPSDDDLIALAVEAGADEDAVAGGHHGWRWLRMGGCRDRRGPVGVRAPRRSCSTARSSSTAGPCKIAENLITVEALPVSDPGFR